MNGRDLAAEGMFEYGSRVGFWRLMRAFQERGLPMTVFGCALALERNPGRRRGDQGVGLRRLQPRLALDQALHAERGRGARAHRQGGEVVPADRRPVAGRLVLPLWTSVNTRRLLLEHGGFTYDSDYYGDELPFWQTVAGKPHLVIPYSLTNNDGKYAVTMGHADQWFRPGQGRLRRPLQGGRDAAQDDVGRHAHAHHRPSPAAPPACGACSTTCSSSRACGSRGGSTSPSTGSRRIPTRARG
jgi:hypothetical protein